MNRILAEQLDPSSKGSRKPLMNIAELVFFIIEILFSSLRQQMQLRGMEWTVRNLGFDYGFHSRLWDSDQVPSEATCHLFMILGQELGHGWARQFSSGQFVHPAGGSPGWAGRSDDRLSTPCFLLSSAELLGLPHSMVSARASWWLSGFQEGGGEKHC